MTRENLENGVLNMELAERVMKDMLCDHASVRLMFEYYGDIYESADDLPKDYRQVIVCRKCKLVLPHTEKRLTQLVMQKR